jgi:rod shape-determining protein MreD
MAFRLPIGGAQPKARRISRSPSPLLAYATPWVTVALASILPGWPLIAMAPVMPPLGFMTLLAWRQLRPGLLPVWAGLPLGLVDDLFSGQPVGCAMLLWSVTMIVLEIIETRFPWRNFLTDWLVASVFILIYIALGALAAGLSAGWALLAPQMVISVICYPLVGRSVGLIDRWRLTRFRVVD